MMTHEERETFNYMLEVLVSIDDLSDLFSYPEVSAELEGEACAVGEALRKVNIAIQKAKNVNTKPATGPIPD